MLAVPPPLGEHGCVAVVGDEHGVRVVARVLLQQGLLVAERSLRDLLPEQAELAVLGRAVVEDLLLLLVAQLFHQLLLLLILPIDVLNETLLRRCFEAVNQFEFHVHELGLVYINKFHIFSFHC